MIHNPLSKQSTNNPVLQTHRSKNNPFQPSTITSKPNTYLPTNLPTNDPFTSSPHPDASPNPPSPRASPPPSSSGGLAVVRAKLQVVRAVLQRGLSGAARPDRVQPVPVLPAGVVVLQLHAYLLAVGPAGPGVLRPVRPELPLLHRRAVLRQRHHHHPP